MCIYKVHLQGKLEIPWKVKKTLEREVREKAREKEFVIEARKGLLCFLRLVIVLTLR